MVALSVLDLVPVATTPTAAFEATVRAAKVAEQAGYQRYWIAEHHNTSALACGATSVLMGHIASATKTIRVGAGAFMLPLHRPLRLAEDLGTLSRLHPQRIEAAVSGGSGVDAETSRLLGRDSVISADLRALQQALAGVPGLYTQVPLCIMGSGVQAAVLAGRLGLPFAFNSHIAPQQLDAAIAAYRRGFVPSRQCAQPYVLATANVMVCDSREEAEFQLTTLIQMFEGVVTGARGLLSPPRTIEMHPLVQARVQESLKVTFAGTGPDVTLRMQQWASASSIDEIITVTYAYESAVREASIQELGNWF
ncbi:MsnO8 family LLM class oxidoreductase [Corynebacterium sp.]|uniref:MsnO8 family LLM class oxidoreductase n=1 Tax=Corynebacterium sp. TaxID=1720 RepID=UPI0026DBCED0|nr:MsnO8 family LLM class oxidoreductase [Corynebacterium sp.]MDO5076678.1 MsnO8 family LLM class oxidoreductase [Corynebacterium sp.]